VVTAADLDNRGRGTVHRAVRHVEEKIRLLGKDGLHRLGGLARVVDASCNEFDPQLFAVLPCQSQLRAGVGLAGIVEHPHLFRAREEPLHPCKAVRKRGRPHRPGDVRQVFCKTLASARPDRFGHCAEDHGLADAPRSAGKGGGGKRHDKVRVGILRVGDKLLENAHVRPRAFDFDLEIAPLLEAVTGENLADAGDLHVEDAVRHDREDAHLVEAACLGSRGGEAFFLIGPSALEEGAAGLPCGGEGGKKLFVDREAFRHDVLHSHLRRGITGQDAAGGARGDAAHLAVGGAQGEERAEFGVRRGVGEDRDLCLCGRRNDGGQRGNRYDVPAHPDRLRAAGKDGGECLGNLAGGGGVRLDELDAELCADSPRLENAGLGVVFGGIPDGAHLFEGRVHALCDFKEVFHGLEGADSHQMTRVLVGRRAGDAPTRAVGLGHAADDVDPAAVGLGLGHRLARGGARREDEPVSPSRNLPRHGSRCGIVTRGVEASDLGGFAVLPSLRGQLLDHSFHRLVHRVGRAHLHDGDPGQVP